MIIEVVPGGRVMVGGHEVDAELNRATGRIRVSGTLSAQAVADRVATLTICMYRHNARQRRERARRRKAAIS